MSYHAGNLRRKLMDVAADMIAGGEEPSIRECSRRLGVSCTAAYAHFAGKDHLIATVAAEKIAFGDGREWAIKCLIASRMMTESQAKEVFALLNHIPSAAVSPSPTISAARALP
jgi:hypothetical protein